MNDTIPRSIAVFDGQLVNPFTVTHRDNVFRIETIAHALALTNRYGGHTGDASGNPVAYSVAEHCLIVERVVRERCERWVSKFADVYKRQKACPREYVRRMCARALVHDAPEAYIGDMVAPFKHADEMWFYRKHDTRLDNELLLWFGLGEDPHNHESDYIKMVDVELRGTEARQLFRVIPPEWEAKLAPAIPGIQCGTMSPLQAKTAWLAKFWELFPNFKE